VYLLILCMLNINYINGDTSEFPGENMQTESDALRIEGDILENISSDATLEDFEFSLNG